LVRRTEEDAAQQPGGRAEEEGEDAMKKYTGWLVLGIAATIGVVGLAVGTAAAQEGGDDDEADVGPGRGRLALIRAALDLTDEQAEEMRETFQSFRADTRALRDQMKEKVKGIPDLVRSSSLSQADLMAVHDQVHDLAGQLGEKRVEMLYQLWQKLTPEQREKLGDLIEEHADGAGFGFLGGHHGRGHGRGGDDESGRADRPGRGAGAERGPRPDRAARAGRGPASL
jgi:Spy/CpxP family protein refolding chaperone